MKTYHDRGWADARDKVRDAMIGEHQRRIGMLLDQREWLEKRVAELEDQLESARAELDELRERCGNEAQR